METLYDDFLKDVKDIKNYVIKISNLEAALGTDIWEGFIGDLFNDLFNFKITPYIVLVKGEEDWQDQATETLYNIIFSDPIEYLEDACKEFMETYLKEYLD